MEKHNFFRQKENFTLFVLLGLIVLSFIMMRFQHSRNGQTNKSDTITTTNKVKTNIPTRNSIPHLLPAL